MKQDAQVAKRYAKAIFKRWAEHLDEPGLKRVIEAAELLAKTLWQRPDLRTFWISTGFHVEEKNKLIEFLKQKKVQKEAVELAAFLVRRKRTAILEGVVQALRELYYQHTKTLIVTITSAFELGGGDKQEMQTIVKGLKVTQNHHCEFLFEVDDRLLGGLLIHMGRYVYDYSLKSSFEQLKRKVETMDVRTLVSGAHPNTV